MSHLWKYVSSENKIEQTRQTGSWFMKKRDYSNATVVKRVLLRVQILADTKLQSMTAKNYKNAEVVKCVRDKTAAVVKVVKCGSVLKKDKLKKAAEKEKLKKWFQMGENNFFFSNSYW